MIAVAIGVVSVCAITYHLFPLIQVVGDSMHPTYVNGEIIVGTRLYRKSKLKKGDVIVYKSPEDRIVIKRINEIEESFKRRDFFCLGDNLDHSYDSRYYGFISSEDLVCKVINQRRNNNHDNVCS